MPSLANHQSNEFTKLLLLGDSKSGKTGSLVSLVKAGYKLCILDYDNLLDSLKYQILEQCPDKLSSVEFVSLRDKTKAGGEGMMLDGMPTAWTKGLKLLINWKYEDVDLGKPNEWGGEYILVIDSLSRLCDAAYNFHETITPAGKSGEKHGQAIYGNAQDDVERLLATLTSDYYKTNVIVIAHGTYMDMPDGTKRIFPQAVGQKLSPKIPQYFPNYIRYKNQAGKRTIQLVSDAVIDLANTKPSALTKSLNINDGLAEFFGVLRAAPMKPEAKAEVVKPKALTLARKI